MQSVAVGVHVVAHSGLAIALGTLLDRLFPKYDSGGSAIIQFLESGAQLTISAILMSELMRVLTPSSGNYVSPIGDGFAVVFLIDSQSGMKMKLREAINKTLGPVYSDIQSGVSGATSLFQS